MPVNPEETLSSGLVAHAEGTLCVCCSTFASLATAGPFAFGINCKLKINHKDLAILGVTGESPMESYKEAERSGVSLL